MSLDRRTLVGRMLPVLQGKPTHFERYQDVVREHGVEAFAAEPRPSPFIGNTSRLWPKDIDTVTGVPRRNLPPSHLRGFGENVKPIERYMDPGPLGWLKRLVMALRFAVYLKGKEAAEVMWRSADDKLNWANHQINYRREPALPNYLDRRWQPWNRSLPVVLPIVGVLP